MKDLIAATWPLPIVLPGLLFAVWVTITSRREPVRVGSKVLYYIDPPGRSWRERVFEFAMLWIVGTFMALVAFGALASLTGWWAED